MQNHVKFSMLVLCLFVLLMVESNALAANQTGDSSYCTAGHLTYISSQIGLDSVTHTMPESVLKQIDLAFQNLERIAHKAGGSLDDIIKLDVYMSDIDHTFVLVKNAIVKHFNKPYPARTPVSQATSPVGPGGTLIRFSVAAVMYNKHAHMGRHCG
jgi:enamine deaminase RidA (YjgF/YER057c/UK114 family)